MISQDFIKTLKEFAGNTWHIESVLIVGSYARGTNKEGSDLDIVMITSDKSAMLADQGFVQILGEVEKKQTEYYGACTSVRVWYKNGLEVEFGVVEPSWIEKPLDAGTEKVLRDGYQVVFDAKHYFQNLPL